MGLVGLLVCWLGNPGQRAGCSPLTLPRPRSPRRGQAHATPLKRVRRPPPNAPAINTAQQTSGAVACAQSDGGGMRVHSQCAAVGDAGQHGENLRIRGQRAGWAAGRAWGACGRAGVPTCLCIERTSGQTSDQRVRGALGRGREHAMPVGPLPQRAGDQNQVQSGGKRGARGRYAGIGRLFLGSAQRAWW